MVQKPKPRINLTTTVIWPPWCTGCGVYHSNALILFLHRYFLSSPKPTYYYERFLSQTNAHSTHTAFDFKIFSTVIMWTDIWTISYDVSSKIELPTMVLLIRHRTATAGDWNVIYGEDQNENLLSESFTYNLDSTIDKSSWHVASMSSHDCKFSGFTCKPPLARVWMDSRLTR